jgi:hypothetical protein
MADEYIDALAEDFLRGPGELPEISGHEDHGADGTSTSVRELSHRGHHVRIETTYHITIDGQPLQGHVEVLPSGRVHYHRFPQYAPQSAVDVVKTVIDTIWDKPEVPDELGALDHGPDQHDDHGHDHDHGDHR